MIHIREKSALRIDRWVFGCQSGKSGRDYIDANQLMGVYFVGLGVVGRGIAVSVGQLKVSRSGLAIFKGALCEFDRAL